MYLCVCVCVCVSLSLSLRLFSLPLSPSPPLPPSLSSSTPLSQADLDRADISQLTTAVDMVSAKLVRAPKL